MPDVRYLTSRAFREQRVDRCRIHVGRRGNRARAAIAHICEQKRFAPDKHVEPVSGERVAKSFGVIPIARAVFHPGDCVWISSYKALHQFWCDPDDRYRWNMVKI